MIILTSEKREEIRQKADLVLQRYRGYTDSFEMLQRIAADKKIDVLEAELSDISGALRMEQGRWRIYINRQDSPTRQLFTLAHELAHFFLHADGKKEFVDGEFVMHRNDSEKDELEELQANEFAGSLVMPKQTIDQVLQGTEPTEEQVLTLADTFHVSPLAMAIRLRTLGYALPSTHSQNR
jgi:Zn-dependent peptidase ImmA (M78 family)